MTVQRLERWIQVLPPVDRVIPFIEVDGTWLSPNDMLREARAGSEIGRKAQRLWESGLTGTDEKLLEERIRKRLETYPSDKPLFIVLGKPARRTPEDILRDVREKTKVGKGWIETERAYLKYLGGLQERV